MTPPLPQRMPARSFTSSHSRSPAVQTTSPARAWWRDAAIRGPGTYASIRLMKRTTLFIDPQLERELQALARRDGRPMAALVREAVARYVAAAREQGSAKLGFIATGRSGRADVA